MAKEHWHVWFKKPSRIILKISAALILAFIFIQAVIFKQNKDIKRITQTLDNVDQTIVTKYNYRTLFTTGKYTFTSGCMVYNL